MNNNNIKIGKGFGFLGEDSKKLYMQRCFKCGRENYAPAVATGQCAWCGHDGTKDFLNLLIEEMDKKKNETDRD